MARAKQTPPTEPLKVCTVKLTPAAEQVLQQVSQDASDALGWTVSSSATLRALIQYAGQQPQAWTVTALHPLIEQEIAQGRVWGSKKRRTS
jgi:uroporphyrinogen-III synthase